MTTEQKRALEKALQRHGKARVIKRHETHQTTIDEWVMDLRPLNGLTLQELKDGIDSIMNEEVKLTELDEIKKTVREIKQLQKDGTETTVDGEAYVRHVEWLLKKVKYYEDLITS